MNGQQREAQPSQQQQREEEEETSNGTTTAAAAAVIATIPPQQVPQQVPAISRRLFLQLSGLCCRACQINSVGVTAAADTSSNSQDSQDHHPSSAAAAALDGRPLQIIDYNLQAFDASRASPLVLAPMMQSSERLSQQHNTVEMVLSEYITACRFYGCESRINAGVLTCLRYALPCLRTSDNFHDIDLLALCEVLLRHCNGPLRYIKRLDFSISGKQKRQHSAQPRGFGSHGAVALAKVLQVSQYIGEVRLQRNSVGPYGASAIFLACAKNRAIHTLGMRRCRVGERGALVFAETVATSRECGLRQVDLSANFIGQVGCLAIEKALAQRVMWSSPSSSSPPPALLTESSNAEKNTDNDNNNRRDENETATTTTAEWPILTVDLEGNLVFQEVMNAVTHGLGVFLALLGSYLMSVRVADKSTRHITSCAVYSTSLIVLYTSSTLYHSFFSMQNTKYIFEVLDKCAIYILIAGSYTPFLQVVLAHEPLWSTGLLAFIWTCCFFGIGVEAFLPVWQYRRYFSLAMYLGMGWSALICLPEVAKILPDNAIRFMILGGVAYTVGVPFYVRSNNLDHAVWHLFVLAGSTFHWLGIYLYVATWQVEEDAATTTV